MERTFFDIHMHAMDLSHPNLLAFLRRQEKWLGLKLLFGGLAEPFFKEKELKFINLLSVMENCIEDYFCLMEHYLLRKADPDDPDSFRVRDDGTFPCGGLTFDTILLTPLIMDFGYKNIPIPTFYDKAPRKPVIEQSQDVFRAIQKYCRFKLVPKAGPDGFDDFDTVPRPPDSRRLLEIYPFLGINTRNYALRELQGVIGQYFGGYTGRRDDLFANMGGISCSMKDMGSNFFAGIKLYPPLGFDPWPDERGQREKVDWLYDFCERRQVPITVHCNDGGFAVDKGAKERTNPEKWRRVLTKYPKLKLNLAHFGEQGKALGIFPRSEWRKTVTDLVRNHENVYTDIACLAFDDRFYKELRETLGVTLGIADKLLFGSDHMINLQWATSYNGYIGRFAGTEQLSADLKIKMCRDNPRRFLFRE